MKETGVLGLAAQVPCCSPVGLGGQVQCLGESRETPGTHARDVHVMCLLSENP